MQRRAKKDRLGLRPALAALCGLGAVVTLTGCFASGSSAAPSRPNLVVLCIDTLRADHLGAFGYERQTSPTIDRLAKEGALFDRVSAQSNWTVPATGTILTSLYPQQHGAGLEGEVKNLGGSVPTGLREGVSTLGDVLSEQGFETALFSANPFLRGRFRKGFGTSLVERSSARELTDRAVDWLQGAAGGRFFLYMQYMDVHEPIDPPEPYFDLFPTPDGGIRGKAHSGWGFGRLKSRSVQGFEGYRANKVALYDGALRYVDDQIHRLLNELETLGVSEHTIVVIVSDHGEEFWDHAETEKALGGDPRGIWGVGHGHSMFQELLRVPWIVYGPQIPPDRRIACDAEQLDVAPTLLRLLGAAPQPQMEGRDLTDYIRGSGGPECEDVAMIASSPAYGPDAWAIEWKGRKLIVRDDGVKLLYDLRVDPRERDDLSSTRPEIVAGLSELLSKRLEQISAGTSGLGEGEKMSLDPKTKEQLRSLGYLN